MSHGTIGLGIVCFLDDDATVDDGWLAAMRAAWERASTQTAMIGGPIRPDWDGGKRPAWVSDNLLWIVTALDLGPEPHRLDRERIWGANMSLRIDPAYFQSFMRNQARRHAHQGNITAGRAAYRSARTAVRYIVAGLLTNTPQRIEARINLSYWASALRVCLRN